ncbi:MAG: hypothetical protein LBJ18_00685 [Rickettsiales bacterium]|jgi:hypothetical protein|nr:hypothetical protein [Rickettsiales bacterium]
MLKKISFFAVLCAFPPAVFGATDYYPQTDFASIIDATANSIRFSAGNGFVAQAGMNISGFLYDGVNDQGAPTGQLYLETGTNTTYSIASRGDIVIGNNAAGTGGLDIMAGRNLAIYSPDTTINVSLGGILNAGTLNISGNIGTLATGAISSTNSITLAAQTITTGAVNSAGTANITAGGALTMGQYVNASGTSVISAASINSGSIQNMTGSTTISTTGNITSTGSIENSGTQMSISTGQNPDSSYSGTISVAGTVKNDNTAGTLVLNAGAWTVSGGTGTNASFVNAGNFYGNITGATTFANGIDVGTMGINNVFSLTTGTLSFGGSADLLTAFYANKLNSFTVNITNGTLTANAISNGASANSNANMTLSGKSVAATSVNNTGKFLSINATDSAGTLAINGAVSGAANSNTQIVSANALNITGTTSNSGNMILNGLNVQLASVVNNGTLLITSPTSNGQIAMSDLTNTGGATNISTKSLQITNTLTNSAGNTTVQANDWNGGAVQIGGINVSGGALDIGVLNGLAIANGITVSGGTLSINDSVSGLGLTAASLGIYGGTTTITAQNGATINGALTQNGGALTLTAESLVSIANGISQTAGTANINTKSLTVGGDVYADNSLKISGGQWANSALVSGLVANITGNVQGAVEFYGLKKMDITGNYYFGDSSKIYAVLPKQSQVAADTTPYNPYSSINLDTASGDFGKITNAASDARAIIEVGGDFISLVTSMQNNQFGLTLTDIVNAGTAVWLVHSDSLIMPSDSVNLRNLYVQFCNGDGSICFDYIDSYRDANGNKIAYIPITGTGDSDDMPLYLSVRDSDGNGTSDSLYIVFDPRFGGPVEVFKIQPIVNAEESHTKGEYATAGALDDFIAGGLYNAGFRGRTPIEAIPLVFRGTNFQTVAQELYDRMEDYLQDFDGDALSRFSRLFQPRELEQVAGQIAMNDYIFARDMEDHMLDEFVWNRNRNMEKAWIDLDFGTFRHNGADEKTVKGDRFSITGGYDWQEKEDLILGVAARVSHSSSNNSDEMDLGYKAGQSIAGRVNIDVADTDIGFGGYLMKALGQGARAYGNAFLDIHLLSVDREQNFVSPIHGSGTAFALTTEWGLMHDLLNQYIVGNIYARAGYNSGFAITEKSGGAEYMSLESDGYLSLRPGYSLIAQKKLYITPFFLMRPNASVGVEYELLGAPDALHFKFAPAGGFTDYDVKIDPLWANVSLGVEFLSASGLQFGLDYRYAYNAEIQMHNVRLGGSYRF